MTDEHVSSSDEDEAPSGLTAMEQAARDRKKRLLMMKSRIHGVEMHEEDYQEEARPTKRSKEDQEKAFRSYEPLDSTVGEVEGAKVKLDLVEEEIAKQLQDAMDTSVVESIDLANLAPKKIDWDLKRDITKKMEKLERRTQKAIVEIIRQRLAEGKQDLASAVSTA